MPSSHPRAKPLRKQQGPLTSDSNLKTSTGSHAQQQALSQQSPLSPAYSTMSFLHRMLSFCLFFLGSIFFSLPRSFPLALSQSSQKFRGLNGIPYFQGCVCADSAHLTLNFFPVPEVSWSLFLTVSRRFPLLRLLLTPYSLHQ